MAKFVSNVKNPYTFKEKNIKKDFKTGQFVSTSKAGSAPMFRNHTASTAGRKVTFKHV